MSRPMLSESMAAAILSDVLCSIVAPLDSVFCDWLFDV